MRRALSPTRLVYARRGMTNPLQFFLGLVCGILLAIVYVPDAWLATGQGRYHLRSELEVAQEDRDVERSRREVAEKTVEVLQHIALARGSQARCSVSGRRPSLKSEDRAAGMATHASKDSNSTYPKIFVYNLPADFNANMLDPRLPRKFDCRSSMYAAEVLIHEQMLSSEHRTDDPEEADLFYVPIYMSCYRSLQQYAARVKLKDRVGILRGRGLRLEESIFEFFLSALDYIQDEEPFWNRQQGRDHIFTFTHDYGACFTYVEEDTMKPERLQVQLALHNAILLQYLGDLASPCFQTWKDIVIPPVITNAAVLALEGGGATTTTITERPVGALFRGKFGWSTEKVNDYPNYSRGVRKRLGEIARNDSFLSIHEGHSDGYIDELTSSKFCIAPPGFALWSPRLAEAVIAGCIPVVIGDGIELPFEDVINYARFVIRVREEDVDQLGTILRRFPASGLRARAAAMMEEWVRFTYNDVPVPGDAFATIMSILHLRARAFRPVAAHDPPDL